MQLQTKLKFDGVLIGHSWSKQGHKARALLILEKTQNNISSYVVLESQNQLCHWSMEFLNLESEILFDVFCRIETE